MTKEIMNAVNTQIFGVWCLIGAALEFWMQAGFAMVEAGFTRAKNAGNIIMKNLMDFCIGTCVFILIGFSLLLGEDMIGLIGKPGFDIFTSYANFDWSSFVFNLVFCATTATIVSGAMAERTKFLSYCIYSAVISALIYPIEAHWIWGGGWLSQMGFHDFAGSCAIHMVGGLSALIGAKFLGPRIGKFTKDKDGNIVVKPIYDMVTEFNEYGYAGIKSKNKWGSINENGDVIKEPTYEVESNIIPSFIKEYYQVDLGYGEPYYTNETIMKSTENVIKDEDLKNNDNKK